MNFEVVNYDLLRDQFLSETLWNNSLTAHYEGLIHTSELGNNTSIVSNTVDGLVVAGIHNALKNGEYVEVSAGKALQDYYVSYVLKGSMDRVHTLRSPNSTRYLARELNAYMKGGLDASTMVAASKFWEKLKDENGQILSNYGHWVWHYQLSKMPNTTQYEYIINQLSGSNSGEKSRKALININQPDHKFQGNKDFPCTISIQFLTKPHLEDNSFRVLDCNVSSRSTDIITGLPYDMAFFSLLNEMVCVHLRELGNEKIILGDTRMNTTFTQVYDNGISKLKEILSNLNTDSNLSCTTQMPRISSAIELHEDIKLGSYNSEVRQWIKANI